MTQLTGYDTSDRFFATRYTQGGRRVYAIDLSLMQVAAYLPAPDPANPTEGNRRVRESHAAAFGTYVREHEDWVSPALLLRSRWLLPSIYRRNLKMQAKARLGLQCTQAYFT